MLTFEEFQQYVRENIKDYLPESYMNAEVAIGKTIKNNGLELTGLRVQKEGSNIGPQTYLDGAYGAYGDGAVLEDIMKALARSMVDFELPKEYENISERLRDFEWVKDRLAMKLINSRKNLDLLSEVPNTKWEDLAAIYQINVATTEQGTHVAMVSNELLEEWGVDKETVHTLAMENSERLWPGIVRPMNEIVAGLSQKMGVDLPDIPPNEILPLYVITNTQGINGAAAILYDKAVLAEVGEYIGDDFFLLPSSIHEWIAVPSKYNGENTDVKYFLNMVKDINMTQVSADEVLADNVYYCSIRNDYLVKALFDEDRMLRMGGQGR